jgi:hypothetical protein
LTCSRQYEGIDTSLITSLGVSPGKIPDPYCGLHYDNFNLGVKSVTGLQPVMPIGDQFAIGVNDSSVTTDYSGSKIGYMNLIEAYSGCYLSTGM